MSFISKCRQVIEAVDDTPAPHFFNPDRKREIEKVPSSTHLFPNLGGKAQKYLEFIVSASYKKLIERIEHYTGKSIQTQNIPSIIQGLFESLDTITQIEESKHEYLEALALECVLSMPEFHYIKQLHDSDKLRFDILLGPQAPDLTNAISEDDLTPETPEDLSPAEEQNLNLGTALLDEHSLRRDLANFFTQGNATNKLFLFNMVSEHLNKIDPRLIKLYGIAATSAQLGYYLTPPTNLKGAGAGGSEEVIPDDEEGVYTIKVRAIMFPYLIHEIVKGIYDYLSMDITSNEELGKETLEKEVHQIMGGPELHNIIVKHIAPGDQKYIPALFKAFLRLPKADIHTVLLGSAQGIAIINKLLAQIKHQYSEFESDETNEI